MPSPILPLDTDIVHMDGPLRGKVTQYWADMLGRLGLAGGIVAILGDLLVGNATGAFDRLGIGSTGRLLTVVAGTAAWAKLDPTNVNSIDPGSLTDDTFIKRSGTVLGSAKVSLTNGNHITASGLTAGQALTFSGGVVTDISGITTSGTLVTNVVPTTDTIFYKEAPSGGDASMTVVIDVAVTTVSVTFTEGIWTS